MPSPPGRAPAGPVRVHGPAPERPGDGTVRPARRPRSRPWFASAGPGAGAIPVWPQRLRLRRRTGGDWIRQAPGRSLGVPAGPRRAETGSGAFEGSRSRLPLGPTSPGKADAPVNPAAKGAAVTGRRWPDGHERLRTAPAGTDDRPALPHRGAHGDLTGAAWIAESGLPGQRRSRSCGGAPRARRDRWQRGCERTGNEGYGRSSRPGTIPVGTLQAATVAGRGWNRIPEARRRSFTRGRPSLAGRRGSVRGHGWIPGCSDSGAARDGAGRAPAPAHATARPNSLATISATSTPAAPGSTARRIRRGTLGSRTPASAARLTSRRLS